MDGTSNHTATGSAESQMADTLPETGGCGLREAQADWAVTWIKEFKLFMRVSERFVCFVSLPTNKNCNMPSNHCIHENLVKLPETLVVAFKSEKKKHIELNRGHGAIKIWVPNPSTPATLQVSSSGDLWLRLNQLTAIPLWSVMIFSVYFRMYYLSIAFCYLANLRQSVWNLTVLSWGILLGTPRHTMILKPQWFRIWILGETPQRGEFRIDPIDRCLAYQSAKRHRSWMTLGWISKPFDRSMAEFATLCLQCERSSAFSTSGFVSQGISA